MELWLPILLFFLGFTALFIELLVPAVGTIGGTGIICMVASTVLAYRNFGSPVGTIFLVGTLVGTPALVLVGLKMFPKTFVGKKLILGDAQDQQRGFTSYSGEQYRGLAGKQGTALTMLRPSGMVMIDDRKYSVVTGGDLIEKGSRVRVVKVEGSRIVVRRLKASDGSAGAVAGPEQTQQERGTGP